MPPTPMPAPPKPDATPAAEQQERLVRVCVLCSSYADSDSVLKAVEGGYEVNPAHFFHPRALDNGGAEGHECTPVVDGVRYTFELRSLVKKSVYRDLRAIVKSGRFDVYFNLCDGARDEDRAGEEVVRALEEFKVPFTGATAKHYELSKPQMKMMAHYSSIRTAPFAVVEDPARTAELCAHLRFPVIVKHISGYSSVGMTKDCKCPDMAALVTRAAAFIDEFQAALVEEFIPGGEATVLACADQTSPDGIRVYPPVQMAFPPGEDFKHFHLKWESFEGMEWSPLPVDHPAYDEIMAVGRRAFKTMMGGVGYGRTDVRIDSRDGAVVFLEVNPNCGIMYPPGEEGSADWILRLQRAHRQFAILQIEAALARCAAELPAFEVSHAAERGGYFMRAARDLEAGTVVCADEGRPFRLFTKEFVEREWDAHDREWFRSSAWPLSREGHVYAIWDIEPEQWRPFNHSCEPTMAFAGGGRSLNVAATRRVAAGEELTMDYATFCDSTMPPFKCRCGAAGCREVVAFDPNTAWPAAAGRRRGNSPFQTAVEPPLPGALVPGTGCEAEQQSQGTSLNAESATGTEPLSFYRRHTFAVGPTCAL